MTIKNRKNVLSGAVKKKVKARVKAKYAGQKGAGSVFARAKQAAKTGKKLSDIAGGGKKTGWSGKGVVKKKDLASGATDLDKKFKGNRAGYVKAQKARTLARQAAKKSHAAAVKRWRKSGGK